MAPKKKQKKTEQGMEGNDNEAGRQAVTASEPFEETLYGLRVASLGCSGMALLGDVSVTVAVAVVDYAGEHIGGYRKSTYEINEFVRLLEGGSAADKAREILRWFQCFPDDLAEARRIVEKNRLKERERARKAANLRNARNARARDRYSRLPAASKQRLNQERSLRRLVNQAARAA